MLESNMRYSERWIGDRPTPQRRLLAIVTIVAGTLLGCEAHTANDPRVMAVTGTTPANDLEVSSNSLLPCFANSRACGEFRASVGTPVQNAYVSIGTSQLGAWTRTWSPTEESGYMSAVATATVRRGEGRSQREVPYPLAESNFGIEVGDGFVSYNTCNSERNEVVGSSRNSVQGGSMSRLAWYGTFTDGQFCEGPPREEESCDEFGVYVDEGGDPANCPPDGGGSGGTGSGDDVGSGIQFNPGDFTNGETVNWNTGIGNGGASVCGSRAEVDYVCIDTWNERTGSWEEWGCGYVTKC